MQAKSLQILISSIDCHFCKPYVIYVIYLQTDRDQDNFDVDSHNLYTDAA